MSLITPFKISVPESKITRLQQLLALTVFPAEPANIEPWTRGPPLADIRRLAHVWQHSFNWRDIEAELNELPQYMAQIEIDGHGLNEVHFIHQPSAVENAIPLLFVHGWPGSFLEVTKILPELVKGGDDYPAFNVVAPSLIDFGFSSASKKSGFNVDQHAEACHKLMQALGYHEYVVQGGDLGSAVARILASTYGPTSCKAHLINNAAPAEPTAESHPALHAEVQATPLTDGELAGLQRTQEFSENGNAFYRLQSTRPMTVAYSLASSPVGLLAWIYEKLHDWADDYPWTDTEVLTWVSVYYFSRAGPSASLNIYYENEHRHPKKPLFAEMQVEIPDVPLGVARFPKDLILLPKLWHHTMGPVVYENEHTCGGHFPAWECPSAIVGDLRAMFGKHGGFDVDGN
ncbi:alpha/beta-hydrolase [Lophium mytilinum]|uniref:Alpha/beta-hydrolase n=1 Tax=Lophium mytilinum TaxID=390894 RepID=A0A6A6R232_9PEZI|nr:alpha/beta-hydrolase [Lophium mytilinum]